eukprot:CAMPEP_0172853870 /NCGR_PEP_ID=MMETSP1075-20121228/57409_1 /TAXON_ID=2916 /ORGANISM="Ceratium fusus, Strain PA161109" /LENGTH=68 /DNA_ID=CAMNT_0013700441 /DNA_START=57 /DNA_END=259 /DNA_ORIENTATION=+
MVARRRNSLVALCISAAVAFGMVVFLEASMGAFVAPSGAGASSTQAGSAASMVELKQPVRQLRTSVES